MTRSDIRFHWKFAQWGIKDGSFLEKLLSHDHFASNFFGKANKQFKAPMWNGWFHELWKRLLATVASANFSNAWSGPDFFFGLATTTAPSSSSTVAIVTNCSSVVASLLLFFYNSFCKFSWNRSLTLHIHHSFSICISKFNKLICQFTYSLLFPIVFRNSY